MNNNIDAEMVAEKIVHIIIDRLGVETDGMKSNMSLKDDLGIDSFDSLRIIFEVEDEFGIKVPPSEVKNIETIDDIVSYIMKRMVIGLN